MPKARHMPSLHQFSQISQKRRRQVWGTCAQIKNTLSVQILTSQVKRSDHQVRSKSDVHSGTGFKLEERVVGTVLVRTFSNFQDGVLKWIPTECRFRIFNFSDLRSGQFSTQPIIALIGSYSFANYFWTKGDRRMKLAPVSISLTTFHILAFHSLTLSAIDRCFYPHIDRVI